MAPKRSTPVQVPPASSSSSSSSSEDEETSSGEEESSSEDNQPQKKSSTAPLTQTPKPVKKAEPVQSKSESESGDESDSESDEVAPTNGENSKSRVVSGKFTLKRAREVEEDADAKDSKRSKTSDTEDPKKLLFQRLWSDKDEIALLNGIVLFIDKKGSDPSKDMSSFFDFVKKSLHLDASLSQVKDKVMRLKRKFENQIKRGKKEGKTFAKAHDQEVFRLSRKIWGKEGLLGESKTLPPSVEKQVKETGRFGNGAGTAAMTKVMPVGIASMEEYVMKNGLGLLDDSKRSEMEQKLMKIQAEELKLFVKRHKLMIELAELMFGA